MNWSIHKTLEDAKQSIENQFNLTKTRKSTKIASENIVDVEFGSVPTKAKKSYRRVYRSYFCSKGNVRRKIIDRLLHCRKCEKQEYKLCDEFWNNDLINPDTKLPPLLEKVMNVK